MKNSNDTIINGINLNDIINAKGSINIYGSTIVLGNYNGKAVYSVLGNDYFDLGQAVNAASRAHKAANHIKVASDVGSTAVNVGKFAAKAAIKTIGGTIGIAGLITNAVGHGAYTLGKKINETTKKF